MNRFTFNEYADMQLCYGAANTNAHEARRTYAERFPGRQLPCHVTFVNVDRRLRETGTFKVSNTVTLATVGQVNATTPEIASVKIITCFSINNCLSF